MNHQELESSHHVQGDAFLIVVIILHDTDIKFQTYAGCPERKFQLRDDIDHKIVFQVSGTSTRRNFNHAEETISKM